MTPIRPQRRLLPRPLPLALVACATLLRAQDAASPGPADAAPLPELVVTSDDTVVTRSCTLVVPEGLVLVDDEGDGVVQIATDGVEVVFAPGSVLRGAPDAAAPDGFSGVGIAIRGARSVVLRGAVVRGYKVGLDAVDADGLLVEGCDVSDNFAQRLRSTPQAADDGADWLAPHDNDAREWTSRYGAGLSLLRCAGATVRGCRARRTQNGLVLDRVTGARVFDNDFSFLSGWGLAMWRSSDCVITRNALDFCVRGYSHGVYNRGQDSAGLLMFEQCLRNVIAENSITHGGDGVFAFAGREALGETGPAERGPDAPCGNDGNLFVGNDLSSAAAHGLELTFSKGNVIRENRFDDNAICGVWGGYGRDTLVEKNVFTNNGEAGYGKERGGVNVEHGARNLIRDNAFSGNRCGVHLWWDEDASIAKLPWAARHGVACEDNAIVGNRFGGDALAVELRGATRTLVAGNRFDDVGQQLAVEGEEPARSGTPVVPATSAPALVLLGETRPVGARSRLAGRAAIVMTEWGPWDHASPLLRRVAALPGAHTWELLATPDDARLVLDGEPGLRMRRDGARVTVALDTDRRGVFEYALRVEGTSPPLSGRGRLSRVSWTVTAFPWTVDPREDEDGAAFAAAAESDAAATRALEQLQLRWAGGGPSDLPAFADAVPPLPEDRFGTRAQATIPLEAGRWTIELESDDGVRVTVDGVVVHDDWTWHAPRKASIPLELAEARDVHVLVEHFELDGYAVLTLDVRRAR